MDTKKLYIDNFDRLKNHRFSGDSFDNIISKPRAFWYGWGRYDKKHSPKSSVSRLLKRAGNDIVTLVLYNIVKRDLGHYSAGGASTVEEYKEYVDDFATAIDRECIVIVEPDALPHMLKLESLDFSERAECLIYATESLKQTPAKVYIDVGHPNWLSTSEVSKLLMQTETDIADGFSVNVSNFVSTDKCVQWANEVSHMSGGLHYVIDTSRNGAETDTWLNPDNAKIGTTPTMDTDIEKCDAFLWIKLPGESDGKAQGAPKAGKFYAEYAKRLVDE